MMEGHDKDATLSAAIGELRTHAALVRVLGSWNVPRGPAALVLD